MNLYELSGNYQRLLDLLESVDVTSEPEYAQALQDTLDSVNDVFEDKAEGYVMVANQMTHDIKMVKTEMDRLKEKKTALENNLKKLKDTLASEMIATGKEKIKTPRFTIYIQNNPHSLEVKTEEFIPKEYFTEQEPVLNKRKLLDYLKAHEDEKLEGVEVKQTRGLRYR